MRVTIPVPAAISNATRFGGRGPSRQVGRIVDEQIHSLRFQHRDFMEFYLLLGMRLVSLWGSPWSYSRSGEVGEGGVAGAYLTSPRRNSGPHLAPLVASC